MTEDKSVKELMDMIASGDKAYEGICAAAVTAAMGTALGEMAAELTLKSGDFRLHAVKEGYATDTEEDDLDIDECRSLFMDIKDKLSYIRDELMYQIEADGENIKTFAKACSLPEGDSSRVNVLENARRIVCASPIDVIRLSAKTIGFLKTILLRGSEAAASDISCAAHYLKSAMKASSVKIFIQTKEMADKNYAASLEKEVNDMLDRYVKTADAICEAAM